MFKQDVDKHLLGVSDPASGQVNWLGTLLRSLSTLALICFVRMCQAVVWGSVHVLPKLYTSWKTWDTCSRVNCALGSKNFEITASCILGMSGADKVLPTVEWVYGQSLEREREVTSLTEAGILWDVLCICSFHNLLSNPSSLQSSTPLQ